MLQSTASVTPSGRHVRRRSEEHSDVLVAFIKALAMVKVPCQKDCMCLSSAYVFVSVALQPQV